MNDTRFLALTAELWGIFHGILKEIWPWHVERTLYRSRYDMAFDITDAIDNSGLINSEYFLRNITMVS